jgi:hypothetical protein
MNFELLTWTQAKINSVNTRSEMHGPNDLEPAVDLSLTLELPNSVLTEFDGWLLNALYFKSEASSADQSELDGVEPVSDRPDLRMPKLAYPLKWDQEGAGYTLTIDHGLGGASNLALACCKVNAFAITPKQGGTVELKCRVQCSEGLTEATLGKLAMLVQHSVPIMLQAPDPGQQPEPELALGGVAQPKATPGRHKPRRSKRTAAHA